MDQRALQLAAQHRLEAAQVVAVEAGALGVGVATLLAQLERAPDALHVHADHARALALAAERGHREAREVAHLAVVARADRGLDLLPQVVEVDPLAALEACLLEALLDGLRLDGAEEEAVEDQLEHAPVLLGLGERRGERLAEVLALGPAHFAERVERVQQLGGADLHALVAELLAEAHELRREARQDAFRQAPEAAVQPAAPAGR